MGPREAGGWGCYFFDLELTRKMAAPTYNPVYMTNETLNQIVIDATGKPVPTSWNVNPQYCLSQDSAAQLLAILQAAYPQYTITMQMMDPEKFDPASPVNFNLAVPWLVIVSKGAAKDGSDLTYPLNAGQFSAYWASASMAAQGQYNDVDVAWRNAQQDISEGLNYTG